MDKIFWTTEKRKVSDLVPYDGNPRQMSKEQAEDLQKSLEKFNLAEIPAINTNNTILAGHMRLRIMKQLGRSEEEIDVRVPNRQLTIDEEKEYLLRSNKNTGSWDYDTLANFDEELLKQVGFAEDELAMLKGAEIDDLVEGEDVDITRTDVIIVDGPNAPKLKNRKGFYFENIDDFNKVVKFFETKTEYKLDGLKLIEFLNK